MIINKKELIEAVQFYYGVSKKQAKEWIKDYSLERKQYLIEGYREQLHKAFYED